MIMCSLICRFLQGPLPIMTSQLHLPCTSCSAVMAPLLVLLLSLIFWFSICAAARLAPLPPGPLPWPIIGNLPIFAAGRPHRTLAALSQKYKWPLISLRLGSVYSIVACTADMAREFLQTHDAVFCDRPPAGMVDVLFAGGRNVVGFQNSGPRWREMRKLWTMQLLSQAMVEKNQKVREEEVARMVEAIREEEAKAARGVNVQNCIVQVTGNIMGRLVVSERFFESVRQPHELCKMVEATVQLMFTPLVGDFVPGLSWLDRWTKRKMVATREKVEELFDRLLDKRLQLRSAALQQQQQHSPPSSSPAISIHADILDVLLDQSGPSAPDPTSRGFIYGTLLEMFIAGIDTTLNSVAWALAELLTHPKQMIKVQREIEEVVGLQRIVSECDLPKLNYLQAVIKESFRMHPVAVMLIPHMSKEACKVASYSIPANTRVFLNLYAIGRDPLVWENPDMFTPERFIAQPNIDLNGRHFGLLPFGSGRRICPGISQGLTVLKLTLANLVHCFDWSPIPGKSIDLRESNHSATVLTMASPLVAIPKFRLNRSDSP